MRYAERIKEEGMTDRPMPDREGGPRPRTAVTDPRRARVGARPGGPRASTGRWIGSACAVAVLWSTQACAADYASLVPSRCIHEMGEWGEQAVHECIRRDLPAAQALEKYPRNAEPLIDRCIRETGRNGWSAVKECVDKALPSSNPPAAQ